MWTSLLLNVDLLLLKPLIQRLQLLQDHRLIARSGGQILRLNHDVAHHLAAIWASEHYRSRVCNPRRRSNGHVGGRNDLESRLRRRSDSHVDSRNNLGRCYGRRVFRPPVFRGAGGLGRRATSFRGHLKSLKYQLYHRILNITC